MATVVRVGVTATLAPDPTPAGTSWSGVVLTDAEGNVISQEMTEDPPGTVIDVIQFAELDSGERVTVEGGQLEAVYRERALLEEDLRSFVVEDPEMAAIEREEEGEDYEPELQALVDALAERGIDTDADELATLPAVIEVDDVVRAKFD